MKPKKVHTTVLLLFFGGERKKKKKVSYFCGLGHNENEREIRHENVHDVDK